MYIESVSVENFRCFKEATVRFEHAGRHRVGSGPRLPNVNLILGDNGTGKSALLTAIALSVLGRVIQSSGFRPYLLVRRVDPAEDAGTHRLDTASVQAKIRLHFQDAEEPSANWSDEATGSTTGQAVVTRLADTETISSVAQVNPGKWKPLFEDTSPAFFMAAYGASRRVSSPEAFDPGAREKSRSPRYQRVAGIFEEGIPLVPLGVWGYDFRQKGRLAEGTALLNALLPEPVQMTVEALVMAGQLITREDLAFRVRGIILPFSALSDGYRGFVGWVMDLLYQMLQVTPAGQKLTDLCGVVIVDELDLLLHPAWQRTVIETIATTFPRLQFFFTSHSPIITGTLEAANLIVTEIDQETKQVRIDTSGERVYGLSADQVLSSRYFGVASSRAPGAVRQLRDLARKAQTNPKAAEDYLRLLADGMDSTGSADGQKSPRAERRRGE